jgi:hypothetical protein
MPSLKKDQRLIKRKDLRIGSNVLVAVRGVNLTKFQRFLSFHFTLLVLLGLRGLSELLLLILTKTAGRNAVHEQ